jgi:hypothetical protein
VLYFFFDVVRWVVSASSWAAGEFYLSPNYDSPIGIFEIHRNDGEALRTSRWYASWLLVLAALPIVLLHLLWIPATLCGYIGKRRTPQSHGKVDSVENNLNFMCGSCDPEGGEKDEDDLSAALLLRE